MTVIWHGLLEELAIVALVVSVLTHGLYLLDSKPLAVRRAMGAIVAGGGVILLMSFPVELQPGLYSDLRASAIGLTGFIGGPLAGAVTATVAGIYRAYLGGVGMVPGEFGIALAAAVGAAGHLVMRGRQPQPKHLILFATVLTATSMAGYLLLPNAIVIPTLAQAGLPAAALTFAATLVAGLALLQDIRQRADARANLVYRSIIDRLPDALNAKDARGRFLAANPATARLMRAPSPDALIGKTDADFYPPEVARQFRNDEAAVLAGGKPVTVEQKVEYADGTTVWLSTLKVPIRDEAGGATILLTHNRDITERKRLAEEIAVNRRRLDDALKYMADGLVMFDREARIVLCNDRYRSMFPVTADLRVPGAHLGDILRASIARGEQADVPHDKVDAWVAQALASASRPGEREVHLTNGRWLLARVRPTADGGSLSVIADITETKRAEQALSELNHRLANLANTDALTGLVNRRGYDIAFAREFARSQRTDEPLSLLLIDVDRFKPYNDTYGHPAGDECLRAIARCLKDVLKRPTDVAARYGGEEFAALLPGTSPDGAWQMAEEFRTAVRALNIPHTASERGYVTVSVGIANSGGGLSMPDKANLARAADAALYAAKAAGRDQQRSAPYAIRFAAASNG